MGRSEAIRRLERRLDHLRKRIENSSVDLSFDKSEISALEYAIRTLKDERTEKQKLFNIVAICNKHDAIWADEIRAIALKEKQ